MKPTAASTNRILISILEAGKPRVSSRVLSDLAGVSQRAASDTMRFLEFHGGLSARRELRWRRTAEILSMLRLPAMNPVRTLPTDLEGPDACRILEESGIDAAMAFTTAANEWAFFEPHHDLQLFVDRGSASKAANLLRGAPARPGAGRTVTLFLADLDSTSTTTLKGVTTTTRLQTWIDLAHFPRAGAHEAFFRGIIKREFPQAGDL